MQSLPAGVRPAPLIPNVGEPTSLVVTSPDGLSGAYSPSGQLTNVGTTHHRTSSGIGSPNGLDSTTHGLTMSGNNTGMIGGLPGLKSLLSLSQQHSGGSSSNWIPGASSSYAAGSAVSTNISSSVITENASGHSQQGIDRTLQGILLLIS